MTIKVVCECGKTYAVGDDKSGKRFRCKECGETCQVPAPARKAARPKPEPDEYEDEYEDYGDDYDDYDEPAPRRSPAKKKSSKGKSAASRKKRKSSSSGPGPLKMIGGIISMVLGGGIIVFAGGAMLGAWGDVEAGRRPFKAIGFGVTLIGGGWYWFTGKGGDDE